MNKVVKKLVEEIKYLRRRQLYNKREPKEYEKISIEIGKLITYLMEEYDINEINDLVKE